MNEFVEHFIFESRDLVEQATSALGALEQRPDDAERLEDLFRALHTLKGGAGIVDFRAMERAVHATEDALGRVQGERSAMTTELMEKCLLCLDLVTRWLDTMELSGEAPKDADAQASKLMERIGHRDSDDRRAESSANVDATEAWVDKLLRRAGAGSARAITAVRFAPPPDCFLRGEDPLATIASLPNLITLDLESADPWPPLEQLDPYTNRLTISALSGSSSHHVRTHLHAYGDECDIFSLRSETSTGLATLLPRTARSILEAQMALLSDEKASTCASHIASAGLVAANVFRHCKQSGKADRIARMTEKCLVANDPRLLKEFIAESLATDATNTAVADEPPRPETATRTLRVSAERIDELVRLTGELTVVKNAIGHTVKLAQGDDRAFVAALKNHHSALDQITSELQGAVLRMRVLPLRSVLQRFSRVVREMSAALNKPTKLVIEGDDTEADKAIVEILFEPLLHIVRNAMDHGIESAARRAQRNKPPVANLLIRASRRADQVLIEVSDDGGGVDTARIRKVALERGIATAESLEGMSDAEMVNLVFAPGFSTATRVTELSGRGVGMDAVRTAIARVGGKVSIESQPAMGTLVRFTLPFSVMMSHVVTVEAGGQTFGIPLDAVLETIRVPADSIAEVGAARAIVHRDRTVPVFELARLMQLPQEASHSAEAMIVVASLDGQLGGIRVDRLGERMEVMLKPLDGLLSGIPGIAGTTIMGDGRVLPILDLHGVFR